MQKFQIQLLKNAVFYCSYFAAVHQQYNFVFKKIIIRILRMLS